MRPCQPPADRHTAFNTSPWALPPEFHKQDPCEGSSPYFCWRTAVVLSRALRRKWRIIKSLTSQSPEPCRVWWSGTSKLSTLCSSNPWWILLNPEKASKLSPTPSTTSLNLLIPIRARECDNLYFVKAFFASPILPQILSPCQRKETHQPGRMMSNFPGTDKSITVEPRRHSGLWPFPIGPPSMTRDNSGQRSWNS